MRVRAAAAPLPRRLRVELPRLAPSRASLVVAFALVALAAASYGAARTTSLFAIHHVAVFGGPPGVRERVHAALAPLEGESLVGLRAADVERRLATVPEVAGATYDRAFPHTLRVYVSAERPLAIVRRGAESWLVSARGRILRRLAHGARPALPRLWVPRGAGIAAGATLQDATARRAVRILAAAAPVLPDAVRTVRFDGDDAFVVLRTGQEIRLGRDHDLELKLAVAASIAPRLRAAERYLDVAVPSRPVAGGAPRPPVEVER